MSDHPIPTAQRERRTRREHHSQFGLLRERRFAPFFWTQFLGALNDNVFKIGFSSLVTYQTARFSGVDAKTAACAKHGVAMVPIVYRGPYSKEAIEAQVSGPTTLCASNRAGKFKGREGVVITAVKERTVSTEKKFFDRAALKAVSFEYLERKDGTEYH